MHQFSRLQTVALAARAFGNYQHVSKNIRLLPHFFNPYRLSPGVMSTHTSSSKKFPVKENGVFPELLSYSDGELLQKVLEIVKKEKLYGKMEEYKKVVDFMHPEELRKILDLTMCRDGCRTRGEVDEVLERIVRHSVRTQHPHFYNQLYGGIDEVGLAGAWLLEAINTNQHTYEVGPALVITEFAVIEQMVKLYGWTEGGDGIFCPGGSLANMYSLVLARHKSNPTLKRRGISATDSPLVAFTSDQWQTRGFSSGRPGASSGRPGTPAMYLVFTSDQSHYSISKAAFWMGIGLDNVVSVTSDDRGIMRGAALRDAVQKAKKEGKQPFYVNATAGTTVFGAFDNFEEIAEVCKEEGLWFHIDACWGGAVVLSAKHRHLLNGCEKADSLSWNPHKMLCVPLQCSMFLTKHKGLLHQANCVGATYLFQQDKFYDVAYDTGDKSIQCGRKGDALKLWLTFKIHGMDVIEQRLDAAFIASRYLEEEVQRREGFELVREGHQCTNVCFWYIPPAMRTKERTVMWWQKLSKVAPLIKERLVLEGTLLIGYQPMPSKGLVNFFRMINTSYPVPSKSNMNFVLDEIERRGKVLDIDQLE
ncbi:Pyridoxal phosphate-dependent decarboxylase [Trinorchestia longiramus]|nr:Pyridoxal phosphate-dependent decarboxylase [Trinorchestia longiramus]